MVKRGSSVGWIGTSKTGTFWSAELGQSKRVVVTGKPWYRWHAEVGEVKAPKCSPKPDRWLSLFQHESRYITHRNSAT